MKVERIEDWRNGTGGHQTPVPEPELNYLTKDAILEGLKEQNMVDIRRLLKKGPAKKIEVEYLPEKGLTNTGKVILTLETSQLLKRIRVGLEVIKVEHFTLTQHNAPDV